jgi:iron complex transport system permease protein
VTAVSARPAAAARPRSAGIARGGATRTAGLLLALAALVVAVMLSIMIGSRDIAFSTVWEALTAPRDVDEHFVIWDLRVPRTVVAVVVGSSLGVAGALIQALTRNPLADPGILGVGSGAAFAVTLGVGVFGVASISGYVWFAFLGALVVTIAVYAIGSAGRGGADPMRLVLAGVALGAVLSGLTSAMTLLDPEVFDKMRGWGAGTVVGRSLELVAVTLLAGGATAIAGPIGFVGLMVPHVARWIAGPDQRWIIAYTMVLAPLLLIVADIAGRLIMRPAEIPVGIVTAFVGAPVLVVLIRRRKVSGR